MLFARSTRNLSLGLVAFFSSALGVRAVAQTNVILVRDPHGTAHIVAQTDEGAYYGAGYAAAQDRFFQMSWRRLMYLGITAEYFGRPADGSGGFSDKWIQNDRKARISGYGRYALAARQALDPATELLLQAYVDGVNDAIADPGFVPHPLFATHGIPLKAWRIEDCIGLWLQFGSFFSGDGLSEAKALNTFATHIGNGLTRDEAANEMTKDVFCYDDAAVVLQSDVPIPTQQAMQAYANLHGLSNSENCPQGTGTFEFSHAWAVAASNTVEGSAALVGDPRIEVFAPNILYEWSMIGATFNATGAGLPGVPNLLVGHTPHVAWSPTALGTDQADLFFIEVDEALHPGQYRIDGVWTDYIEDEEEVIKILGETAITVSYRETVWGPVVTDLMGNNFGREYARHMVPFIDPTKSTERGFHSMYQATDVGDLFARSEGWSYPSANLVMADADGNIGYTVVGDIPVRDPDLVLGGQIATSGTVTDYQWIEMLPHDLRPHVLLPGSGRIFSANHMPVGSWYPIPVRFGSGSHGESIRSRRLREMIDAQANFTVAEVFAMHDDTVNAARRDYVLIAELLDAANHPDWDDVDAIAALAHLSSWRQAGAKMDNSHYATLLASKMVLQFRGTTSLKCPAVNINLTGIVTSVGGGDSGLIAFQQKKLSQLTGTGNPDLTTAEVSLVESVLGDAWRNVTSCMGLPNSNTWQAWYDNNVLNFDRSTWTSLGTGPSLDPAVTLDVTLKAVDKQTILSASAQAFTQLVELDDVDGGQTVMPPGSGEGPGTALTNQQGLWESGSYKGAPLTPLGIRSLGVASFLVLSY